jgi:putative membrane protein
MDKNELCKKVSASMLLLTMSLYATPVFAYSKDETVYSKLNSEGNSYKTIVSTHLKNTDSENTLNDMTNLTNIKNTNGDEKFSQNGHSLIWDAQKHDIYYQGEYTAWIGPGSSTTQSPLATLRNSGFQKNQRGNVVCCHCRNGCGWS